MNIGAITKQFATEALGNVVKEAIEGPPEISPDNLSALISHQIQAMQNALKDDQELVVQCTAAQTSIRVHDIFAPSPRLLVLTGADSGGALARIVTPAEAVQLVARPIAVKAGAKPLRVRFITPRPK